MSDGPGGPDSDGTLDLEDAFERLFRDGRTNAVIAWAFVSILTVVFAESVLDVDYQWILFVGVVGIVVLVPPVAYREWRVMLPWELLVLALLPILVRGLVGGTVGTFASYLSLAALALLVIVELHMFTTLEVTHWFAVCLVVLTTLAAVAAWTVFRWNADRYLGTTYLTTNEALMTEWLYVTLAGLAAGVLFDGYFRRRDRRLWRAIRRTVRR
ncbi:hypothetical protein NDI54_05640 [Haloarcula sp. S1AR25-5A]|uniref:Uncharacterized protein n=1 Tax=Haloarcula terrestris TaxID=2950533 RepID=A0AAE4JGT6_9EURY|nr:hypothetical protein [Haloarcula terrestris]MDS0220835.1 hypothetical protein [Haloarcula terrestris]